MIAGNNFVYSLSFWYRVNRVLQNNSIKFMNIEEMQSRAVTSQILLIACYNRWLNRCFHNNCISFIMRRDTDGGSNLINFTYTSYKRWLNRVYQNYSISITIKKKSKAGNLVYFLSSHTNLR